VPTLLIGIAYWVVGIPVGLILAFSFGLGATGIWLGFITGLTLASVFLFLRFRSRVKTQTIVVSQPG
jgi:MATE family multidrug resistance protein